MTEWQLGIKAFQEGRLRAAADRLRAATADQERTVSQAVSFQTYVHLGAALYALGDAAGAAQAFEEAVNLRLTQTPPLDLVINLANAYVAAGKRQQAEQTLTKILHHSPGAMEARSLLARLQSADPIQPLTGEILGETPQSVQRYLDTLSFATVAHGYAADQVNAALKQVARYVDVLSAHLVDRDRILLQHTVEIERLRQAEDTLINNLVQTRQELDQARRSSEAGMMPSERRRGHDEAIGEDGGPAELTPLEKLFQKKN